MPKEAALKNRIALVTGASRGVGRGIAEELGAAGATVYITGRSRAGEGSTDNLPGTIDDAAESVTALGGEGVALACDHAEDDQVQAVVDRIGADSGRLDILVNNAWSGYEQYDPGQFTKEFWKQPVERWDRMFRVGVRSHYVMARLAAPLMLDVPGALIVNISFGDRGRFLGDLQYDSAKAAADRLAFGLAKCVEHRALTVIGLYPGFTGTERVLSAFENETDRPVLDSPRLVGRGVVALAADPDVKSRSGGVFKIGELARDYGFADLDGRIPEPFALPDEP